MGIEISFVDASDLSKLKNAIKPNTKVCFAILEIKNVHYLDAFQIPVYLKISHISFSNFFYNLLR